MIDRNDILVMIPTLDRRVDVGCIKGLTACAPFYSDYDFLCGISDICLARNMIAHRFMEHTAYEWLMFIDSDIIFHVSDWEILWDGEEELVTAEYARKVMGEEPARYGLGFTRIHRSIFERIKDGTRGDGSELAMKFYLAGELHCNYFPNGATGDSRYLGEDRGFFVQAQMVNAVHRLENRTRLGHVGTFVYGYPDQLENTLHPVTGRALYKPENSDGAN